MDDLATRVAAIEARFERIHDGVFRGDPVCNTGLSVEVAGAAVAYDTPVMVLIAPWTITGLAFPPDGWLPAKLRVGHHHHPVLQNQMDGIGSYHAVLLETDVSGYADQAAARADASSIAARLAEAVEKARREHVEVEDQSRRALAGRLAGRSRPRAIEETPFGVPEPPSSNPGP